MSGSGGRPSTWRVSAGAAYAVPTTNRITGPKVCDAGAPMKCSPGSEDSSPVPRTGEPSTRLNDRTTPAARKS